MKKILTVSIAGYHVQKYIRNTLNSLIAEEIIQELEIFVVDDGGSDKTLEIVKEYSEKYPDSILGIHKENGGYGSVINKSVELATGKYFKQLDGDDWFHTENLSKLVALLRGLDVDAVYTPVNEIYEGTNKMILRDHFSEIKEGIYEFDKFSFQFANSMHETTVRTKILKDMNLHVTEHCFYTDVEYVCLPLPYLKTFYVSHVPIYQYRLGVEGQSVSPEGVRKHYKEHEKVFWHTVKIYRNVSPERSSIRNLLMNRLKKEFAVQLKYYCMLDIDTLPEMKAFAEKVKETEPEIFQETMRYSRFAKTLLKSNYLLYPVLKKMVK